MVLFSRNRLSFAQKYKETMKIAVLVPIPLKNTLAYESRFLPIQGEIENFRCYFKKITKRETHCVYILS